MKSNQCLPTLCSLFFFLFHLCWFSPFPFTVSSVEQHHVTGAVLPVSIIECPLGHRIEELGLKKSLSRLQIQKGICVLIKYNSYIRYFCIESRHFFLNECLNFGLVGSLKCIMRWKPGPSHKPWLNVNFVKVNIWKRISVFSGSTKFTDTNVYVWNRQTFSTQKKVAFQESAYFSQVSILISIVFFT